MLGLEVWEELRAPGSKLASVVPSSSNLTCHWDSCNGAGKGLMWDQRLQTQGLSPGTVDVLDQRLLCCEGCPGILGC